MNEVTLGIGNLPISLSGSESLITLIAERYEDFVTTETPSYLFELQYSPDILTKIPKANTDIAVVQHATETHIALEHPPLCAIDINLDNSSGVIRFSNAPQSGPARTYPSPLAFGLRRSIGYIYSILLPKHGKVMLHASALTIENQGIICPGESGTGKSTFFNMFPEEQQLNDEFNIVELTAEHGPRVYSTPFTSSWDYPRKNRHVPLTLAIQLLQAKLIRPNVLSIPDTLRILQHNVVLPGESEIECLLTFEVLSQIATTIKAQSLEFTLEEKMVRETVISLLESPSDNTIVPS